MVSNFSRLDYIKTYQNTAKEIKNPSFEGL
nr:MAG TPA: hypothetical protein [Caudoviricetes sp.]